MNGATSTAASITKALKSAAAPLRTSRRRCGEGRGAGMTICDDISVTPATEADRRLIGGMIQFYIYDFSELEPSGSDRFEPGADGRFEDYRELARYWGDRDRAALVIRRGGRPVGFALLNALSHSGGEVDHNMGEFFVMRKHRRGGVASAALRAILAAYPGRWEIAVARRNTGALGFWPRAVAAAAGVRDLETVPGDGARWTGPILRFVVAP